MSDAANTNNDHGNDLAGKKKTTHFCFGLSKFSNAQTMLLVMTHGKNCNV